MAFLPFQYVMNLKSDYYRNGFCQIALAIIHRRKLLDLGILSLGYTHSLHAAIATFIDTITSHG